MVIDAKTVAEIGTATFVLGGAVASVHMVRSRLDALEQRFNQMENHLRDSVSSVHKRLDGLLSGKL